MMRVARRAAFAVTGLLLGDGNAPLLAGWSSGRGRLTSAICSLLQPALRANKFPSTANAGRHKDALGRCCSHRYSKNAQRPTGGTYMREPWVENLAIPPGRFFNISNLWIKTALLLMTYGRVTIGTGKFYRLQKFSTQHLRVPQQTDGQTRNLAP